MEKIEKFEKLSSGLRNITIVVAILVGAIWALTEFVITKKPETASEQLAKIKLEKQKLKQKQGHQIVINVSAEHIESDSGIQQYLVIGTVTIHNNGLKMNRLLLKDIIKITKVTYDESGKPIFGKTRRTGILGDIEYKDQGKDQPWVLVQNIFGGNTLSFPYVMKVDGTGLYYVDVRIPGIAGMYAGGTFVLVE